MRKTTRSAPDPRTREQFLQALRRPSWLVECFPNLFRSANSANWFVTTRKQQLLDEGLAVETPNGLLLDSERIVDALPRLIQAPLDPEARRTGERAPRRAPTGRPVGRPRKVDQAANA
ncbi:hypothetical protein QTI24_06620 [Variovorax sp. J22P240]|uniref:hypothetical protein n=1 Tax=Variovorax sp. J22P240 TaxID=3053514 RepID=UPI0025771220|nr:hypothetical protein [Variovorax sp. J22P240]MDL9998269.1 hypothetical protein [Variovorax sp. J22P240]